MSKTAGMHVARRRRTRRRSGRAKKARRILSWALSDMQCSMQIRIAIRERDIDTGTHCNNRTHKSPERISRPSTRLDRSQMSTDRLANTLARKNLIAGLLCE